MMLGSVKNPVVGVTLTPDKKRYTEFVGWKKGTKIKVSSEFDQINNSKYVYLKNDSYPLKLLSLTQEDEPYNHICRNNIQITKKF